MSKRRLINFTIIGVSFLQVLNNNNPWDYIGVGVFLLIVFNIIFEIVEAIKKPDLPDQKEGSAPRESGDGNDKII